MNKDLFNAELFARRLQLKQRVLSLSVRQSAMQIGISAPTLSRLNNGKFLPDIITYHLCCKWLGLEMDFFFL